MGGYSLAYVYSSVDPQVDVGRLYCLAYVYFGVNRVTLLQV